MTVIVRICKNQIYLDIYIYKYIKRDILFHKSKYWNGYKSMNFMIRKNPTAPVLLGWGGGYKGQIMV